VCALEGEKGKANRHFFSRNTQIKLIWEANRTGKKNPALGPSDGAPLNRRLHREPYLRSSRGGKETRARKNLAPQMSVEYLPKRGTKKGRKRD